METIIKYSITIPVYNSSEWLENLLMQIEQVMSKIGDTYEIILVNDGSPEPETWPKITQIVKKLPYIKAINLRYNSGQFNALLCAFKHAQGEYIITMDDDFQHDPSDIPKLIAKISEGNYDCVIGNYEQRKHNLFRKAGSTFVNWLLEKVYKKPKNIRSTSFRIMKHDIADALLLNTSKKPQIGWMIFDITQNVSAVTITHHKREQGKSGYNTRHLVSTTMDIIINGSTFPLDIASMFGILISGFAFLIAIIYFILYLCGKINVSGFTALILTISFFSGVILFEIGMLGRYVGRIIQENTGFPAYSEKEILYSDNYAKENSK